MEVSDVFGGSSLKAADLKGREYTLVIADVEMKKFNDANKLVVSFQNAKKSLICNKTNANRIAHMHGTNTDNWTGKEITLYSEMVDFQGDLVEAIRVRVAPRQTQQFTDRPINGGGRIMDVKPPTGNAPQPPRGNDPPSDDIPF